MHLTCASRAHNHAPTHALCGMQLRLQISMCIQKDQWCGGISLCSLRFESKLSSELQWKGRMAADLRQTLHEVWREWEARKEKFLLIKFTLNCKSKKEPADFYRKDLYIVCTFIQTSLRFGILQRDVSSYVSQYSPSAFRDCTCWMLRTSRDVFKNYKSSCE
jgi:hypothetical protein